MLNNDEVQNADDFIADFKKRFSKFCKRSPVILAFNLYSDRVDVYHCTDDGDREIVLTKEFDYSIGAKNTIYEIKTYLQENVYPVYKSETLIEQPMSAKEINELIEKGEITMDNVSPNGIYVTKVDSYRPERILITSDEIFLRHLESDEMIRYKCRMPVTILLKKLRGNTIPISDHWNFMNSKIRKIGRINEKTS